MRHIAAVLVVVVAASTGCDQTEDDATAYYNRGVAWGKKGNYDKAIAEYNEAIRLDPKDADAYYNRGLSWGRKGDYDKAIADFNEAIGLDPKDAWANHGIAWIRATCPNSKYRDGKQAVKHAKKACELLGQQDANYLGTLAAAWAESGDFGKAIKQQQKAIEFAYEAEKAEYRSRLELYKQGKPYREKVKK